MPFSASSTAIIIVTYDQINLQNEPTLEQLIKGCADHNEERIKLFYIRYYGYVLAIALRYIKQRSDAQEITNDVFFKIFKGIAKFIPGEDVERSLKSWISKITANASIDFVRKNKKILFVMEVNETSGYSETIDIVSDLNVEEILKLLDALPEIQRIIFNMYVIEGFSHDEIAELLKITATSSRVYLTRAKQKLRDLYKKSITTVNERIF